MKLKIKPLKEEDLPFLNEVRNEAREFLHDNREFTLEETQAWFKDMKQNRKDLMFFLVYLKDANTGLKQRVGYFRTRRLAHDTWEVGMDIHKDLRGKGYARMAYNKMFKKFPEVRYWELSVLGNNTRAYTLYKSLGFETCAGVIEDVKRGRELIPSIDMVKTIE